MPVLTVSTSVSSWDRVVWSKVASKLSQEVARVMGKPESYVMVLLHGGVELMFEGNEEPGAFAELVSIGGLTAEVSNDLCGAIACVLETELSVPASRCYVKLHDTKVNERASERARFCSFSAPLLRKDIRRLKNHPSYGRCLASMRFTETDAKRCSSAPQKPVPARSVNAFPQLVFTGAAFANGFFVSEIFRQNNGRAFR